MTPVEKALRSLKLWTIALYLVVATAGATMFIVRSIDLANVQRIADENKVALCALRADIQARVQSSLQFLENHPNGIPGIPPEQIRESIENQRRTIDALRVVDCSDIIVNVGT